MSDEFRVEESVLTRRRKLLDFFVSFFFCFRVTLIQIKWLKHFCSWIPGDNGAKIGKFSPHVYKKSDLYGIGFPLLYYLCLKI